jgi:hypothetical protein
MHCLLSPRGMAKVFSYSAKTSLIRPADAGASRPMPSLPAGDVSIVWEHPHADPCHLSMKGPAPWSCGHPRCSRLGALSLLDVYLCHLGDIHHSRFSAFERERLSRSLLLSRLKWKRQGSTCSANSLTKIRSGMKRGTGIFVTYNASRLKQRFQNRDRRKHVWRQSLQDIENLGLSKNICGKKGRASGAGAEGIRMLASASDSAKTVIMTPSTIHVEQGRSLNVHNNLELSSGG